MFVLASSPQRRLLLMSDLVGIRKSTTLSRNGSNDASLSMSKRLCQLDSLTPYRIADVRNGTARRFAQPVFLSLDLPLLDAGSSGISTEQSGSIFLQLERLVVKKMQETIAGPPKASAIGSNNLSGEMVGR